MDKWQVLGLCGAYIQSKVQTISEGRIFAVGCTQI